jgi:phosphonate transport system permease protein
MTGAVVLLPPASFAPLAAHYRAAVAAKRRRVALGLAIALACGVAAAWTAEVDPVTLVAKIGNFTSYIDRIFRLDSGARVWTDPAEWFWGLRKWSWLMAETMLMAYVGTLWGAGFAFCASFVASRNLVRAAWLRWSVRRFLEICRTVPEIVFALIFVVAFGLGPLPGVLAIAIHTAGALGKLFSEVVENIDMKPVEGVASTGASWLAQMRFGAVPQVLANFASYALLRFEINVRGAAVLGFVGAGGIGQDFVEAIRKFYYSDVSAILILIIGVVMVIDLLTEKLRHRLAGLEARP